MRISQSKLRNFSENLYKIFIKYLVDVTLGCILIFLTSCVIVECTFYQGKSGLQARVASPRKYAHLCETTIVGSRGVHPISAVAAECSALNDRTKSPQRYGKNMSYIINVRDGQDAHYLIANIYSST